MRQINPKIRYYPVGLISLLLIPLSYFLALYKANPKRERLFYCSLYYEMGCTRMSSGVLEFNYVDVYLPDDKIENKSKINMGKELIRELTASKKPVHGIHFHLSDKVKFETVMSLLNTCAKENKSYALLGDNIWVFHPKQHYNTFQIIE
ncbi:MAG TPA: hypothetical protein VK151_02930 [Fluviicola sp.]|nr:hypothetical protein [Fluviicola sp.]